MPDAWNIFKQEEVDAARYYGGLDKLSKLARILTEAREGKSGPAWADYLRALDDIAEAMDLARTEDVRYTA